MTFALALAPGGALLVPVGRALADRNAAGFRIGLRVAGSRIATAALGVPVGPRRGGTGLSRW